MWKSGKEPTCQCRRCKRCWFDLCIRKIPWRTKWSCTPLFMPGESHGQDSLAGYSPWGCKESDTNDLAYTHKKEYTMHWQIYLGLQSSKRNRSLICLLPGRWLYFQNKVLDLSHVTTEL